MGKEIGEFLKTQPKIKCEEYDIELDCDLEYIVNELVEELIKKRDEAKLIRWAKNETQKSLVFKGADGAYYTLGWKSKAAVELMVNHPIGREKIKAAIAEQAAKGSLLINGNIPADLLPEVE